MCMTYLLLPAVSALNPLRTQFHWRSTRARPRASHQELPHQELPHQELPHSFRPRPPMDLNSESESEDELPTPTPSSQPAEVPSEAEPAMAPAMQATQAATQAATQGSAEPGPAEATEPEAPTRWPLVAPTSETVRHKGAGARKSEWAACDRCNKWRRLPRSVAASSLPDPWYCEMNTWDEQRNRCEVAEERLRYGDGNEQDDLSVIPTVAPDGTQLVMSADSATGYKGVALSSGGKRSRDEAAALPDTAAYRVEYALDKDGNLAPKGAGVRNTRYFASCLEAATWHAASPRAPCSTRACTRACREIGRAHV